MVISRIPDEVVIKLATSLTNNKIGVTFSFPVKYDMSIRQRVDLNDKNVMTDNCHNLLF